MKLFFNPRLLCILSLMILFSCSNPISEVDSEQEVRNTFNEFVEAYKRLDIVAVLSHLSPENGFMMLQTNHLEGEEITTYFVESISQTLAFEFVEITNLEIHMMSEEIAVLRCNFSEKYILKNGGVYHFEGASLYVFQKIASAWKIVHLAGAVKN